MSREERQTPTQTTPELELEFDPELELKPPHQATNGDGADTLRECVAGPSSHEVKDMYRSHRVRGQKIAVEAFGSTPTKDPRLNIDTAHLMS